MGGGESLKCGPDSCGSDLRTDGSYKAKAFSQAQYQTLGIRIIWVLILKLQRLRLPSRTFKANIQGGTPRSKHFN